MTEQTSCDTLSPSADSSAAAKRVQIPELLEMILLCLPRRDLLLAPRVCQHWREVIHGSPTIKRALFLSPNGFITTFVDPLEPRNGRKFLSPNYFFSISDGPLKRNLEWGKIELNPMLTKLRESYLDAHPKAEPKRLGLKPFTSHVDFHFRLGTEFIDPLKASWEEMLLTQPPKKTVELEGSLEYLVSRFDGCYETNFVRRMRPIYTKTLYNPAGVTLGEVFVAAKLLVETEASNKEKYKLESRLSARHAKDASDIPDNVSAVNIVWSINYDTGRYPNALWTFSRFSLED